MTATSVTLGSYGLHVNDDVDETEDDVDSGAGVLHEIEIDNTLNAAVTYVKLWDGTAGSTTPGTTAPDFIFRVAAGVKRTFVIPEGAAYATALCVGAVTTPGTAGTTGPTSAVSVRILFA